jgi:hypothetical protein
MAVPAFACIAADPFAHAGAKAVLTVDYSYGSEGRRKSEGLYDPYEWRVKRTLSLAIDLAAQAPLAMPTVQPMDGSHMASIQKQAAKTQAVATTMAPMMADAQKIMAKCGEDEACITREAMNMGAAMQGTPQMDAAMGAKKDIAELSKPGAARYQAWRATAQRGTYAIEEAVHVSIPDPICNGKPRNRCTRDEVRKGGGAVPVPPEAHSKGNQGAAAGLGAVEVDNARNTLTINLPNALGMLPYTETITTDEPAGSRDTPTPKGPQARQLLYRVSADGSGMMEKPFTVPLKGGWRDQSGERVVKLKGRFGDEGTLTVRWRFKTQ